MREGPFHIKGMVGIRMFGWQADVTNHRIKPPIFSERYRGQHGIPKRPRIHVGPFCGRVTKLSGVKP